jgi:hypothetical protein
VAPPGHGRLCWAGVRKCLLTRVAGTQRLSARDREDPGRVADTTRLSNVISECVSTRRRVDQQYPPLAQSDVLEACRRERDKRSIRRPEASKVDRATVEPSVPLCRAPGPVDPTRKVERAVSDESTRDAGRLGQSMSRRLSCAECSGMSLEGLSSGPLELAPRKDLRSVHTSQSRNRVKAPHSHYVLPNSSGGLHRERGSHYPTVVIVPSASEQADLHGEPSLAPDTLARGLHLCHGTDDAEKLRD